MLRAPGEESTAIVPQGTHYHQWAMKYYQWTGYCLMLSAPGEVNCHCVPGELSITSWPWNTISACHHQWTGHIVKCITSRLWTIITSGLAILLSVPRKSLLSLCPRGTQYHRLALKYCHQWKSLLSLCPRGTCYHQLAMKYYHWSVDWPYCWVTPGRVCSHCAPREIRITSWPWNIITSGLVILFNVEWPQWSQLSLCPRGTQYHQLALKACEKKECPHRRVSLIPRGTQYHQLPMKYYHQWFKVECPQGRFYSYY